MAPELHSRVHGCSGIVLQPSLFTTPKGRLLRHWISGSVTSAHHAYFPDPVPSNPSPQPTSRFPPVSPSGKVLRPLLCAVTDLTLTCNATPSPRLSCLVLAITSTCAFDIAI